MGEACNIATRLLNNFDRDNVHIIRRMDDRNINSSYHEIIKQVGMYDNWNIITHKINISTREHNDYEERMIDYARMDVATKFIRHFMR